MAGGLWWKTDEKNLSLSPSAPVNPLFDHVSPSHSVISPRKLPAMPQKSPLCTIPCRDPCDSSNCLFFPSTSLVPMRQALTASNEKSTIAPVLTSDSLACALTMRFPSQCASKINRPTRFLTQRALEIRSAAYYVNGNYNAPGCSSQDQAAQCVLKK